MYNQGPFADWVPKPLMAVLIILFLLPILAVTGVYSGSISDTIGAFGTYSEIISMANNATTIGMGMGMIIVFRIKTRFRSIEIITGSAIILAVLSIMIATANNPQIVVVGSFLIGFFKVFPMIEMIIPVMFMISPKGDRGKFYSLFYPFTLIYSQVYSYWMTNSVSNYNWELPYYFSAICMLSIAALSLIFQHRQRFSFKVPLYQIDWLSLLMLPAGMMFLNYGITFMKQQNWFTSPSIVWSLTAGALLLVATIYRQSLAKRKLVKFKLFITRSNVIHSVVLLLFLGLFLASSSLFVQYTVGALGYSNVINAELNLWMIPGYVIAGALAFIGFKKEWNLKYYVVIGFLAFFLHTLMLYLMIQPQMNIEYLYVLMIVKGVGMGSLFIAIWFYGSSNLDMNDVLGVIGILLMIRTFIATALGGALISWASYQGQWQSLSDSSMYLDNGFFPNGLAIYGTAQIGAILASSKVVLGALCWMIIPILIFVWTHHYGVFNFRRIVFFRKLIKGDSIKGYKL